MKNLPAERYKQITINVTHQEYEMVLELRERFGLNLHRVVRGLVLNLYKELCGGSDENNI